MREPDKTLLGFFAVPVKEMCHSSLEVLREEDNLMTVLLLRASSRSR